MSSLSPFCADAEETLEHLFWRCHVSRAAWFGSALGIVTENLQLQSYIEWLGNLLQQNGDKEETFTYHMFHLVNLVA